MTQRHSKAIVCAISASDSSGHAGHQCDLRVIQDLGAHGVSVISGLTAQNSLRVSHVEVTSASSFAAQMVSLREDLSINTMKTGLLLSAGQVQQVVAFADSTRSKVVVDPVLGTTSGTDFASAELLTAYRQLIARADLLTPNIPEAERLLGVTIAADADIIAAAAALRSLGSQAVLIKGGHRAGFGSYVYDYYDDGEQRFWLRQPRLRTDFSRGTGCALAAAVATFVALGKAMRDAVVLANAYLHQSLRAGFAIGRGNGLLGQRGWPEDFAYYPAIITSDAVTSVSVTPAAATSAAAAALQGADRPEFARCDTHRLGLYPVVDTVGRLGQFLRLGVTTVQLRLKNVDDPALERDIVAAIALGRRHRARVFINDHWQLAMRHGAYGVHLGQEDLEHADLTAIRHSGLRLGLSSHSEFEWLRAASYRPSYIALGAVFPTRTKSVHTIGLANLRRWSCTLAPHFPLVAIGGINLENLDQVLECGIGSAAVVSALHPDLPDFDQLVHHWQQRFGA